MELTIQAKMREVFGKQNERLRKQGLLPAVLYGKGQKTLSLQVSAKDFEKIFRQAGESTLINLKIEGDTERKVLIHDVARHFMKGTPIHVDFYEVDLTKKIHAKIPLHFTGIAPAVKELGGVLLKNLNEIEVEALPADLPQFIEVNIEKLKTFDNLVRLQELKTEEKVKILGHPEEVVISVQAPRTEEELLELEKPAAEEEKAAIEGMVKEADAEKAEKEATKDETQAKEAQPEAKKEEKK